MTSKLALRHEQTARTDSARGPRRQCRVRARALGRGLDVLRQEGVPVHLLRKPVLVRAPRGHQDLAPQPFFLVHCERDKKLVSQIRSN